MKVIFKESTNFVGEVLQGVEVDLSIGMTLSFTFNPYKKEFVLDDEGKVLEPGEWYDFELRRGTWSTSQLESITYDEVSRNYFVITAKTRNSTYVFTQGEKTNEKCLTKEERIGLAIQMGIYLF